MRTWMAAATASVLVLGCSRAPAATPNPVAISNPAAPATPTAIVSPTATRASAGEVDVTTLRRPAGKEWFGLFLVGKKAGYTWTQVGVEEVDGAPALVARQETEITAAVGDRTVVRVQRDLKAYQPRPGGRLLSFRSERRGDGGDRTVTGRCDAERCTLEIADDSGRSTRAIPAPGETAEQADAARLCAARRASVAGPQLDLEQLRVRQVEDHYRGRSKLAGAGVEVEVALVEEREVGDRAATEIAVADDGRVLELKLGGSVAARAETEEMARRAERVDLFGLTRVPLPGPLPHRVPLAITYRLSGLPPAFREADARQAYRDRPGGQVLLTVTARQPAAADPARDAPRAKGVPAALRDLLTPSPSTVGEIDSDSPAIRALAAQVAGDAPGVYAAARRINAEVFRRLEKAFGQSRDRASEVLVAGKGDCTEHALLFTALARAAGVPARPVYGLVHTRYGDGRDALYWHAWAEVKSGPEWIALDPTFGQEVADATHLALGRGTQVDAVGLLGSLEVISAEPGPAR